MYRSTNVTISRVALVVKAHADHLLIAGPPGFLIRNDNSRIVGGRVLDLGLVGGATGSSRMESVAAEDLGGLGHDRG